MNKKHPERTKSIFWCTESGRHVFSKMMTATMLSINPTIPKLEHTIAQSMFVITLSISHLRYISPKTQPI